ncbi:MAG TPA: SgcJ/EcaC family oxidoreductase [Thermomicrobiales bacterium]
MAGTLTQDDEVAIRALVAALVASWNAADGAGYAAWFTEDADFVNIYGLYVKGRAAIAAGHQQIFDTVYRGSTNSSIVEGVRALVPRLALARVAWHLRIPAGEAVRENQARATLVLAHTPAGWRIAAFQNTVIAAPGGPRPGAAHS